MEQICQKLGQNYSLVCYILQHYTSFSEIFSAYLSSKIRELCPKSSKYATNRAKYHHFGAQIMNYWPKTAHFWEKWKPMHRPEIQLFITNLPLFSRKTAISGTFSAELSKIWTKMCHFLQNMRQIQQIQLKNDDTTPFKIVSKRLCIVKNYRKSSKLWQKTADFTQN